MDERQKRILDVLKKVPNAYCVDVFFNKLYVLVDEEFLLCFVGPDFNAMTDSETRRFVNAALED